MSGPERPPSIAAPESTRTGTAAVTDAPTPPDPSVILDMPFTVEDLYPLRAAVIAHADAAGAPGDVIDALLIVVGELASNAVLHGGGHGQLTLYRTGNQLTCQVRDHGPGLADPDRAGTTAVPASVANGRGLWIIRQLAAHVDIDTGPHGTTVTVIIQAQHEHEHQSPP
jgi:anti-sigma regulatory factor (Ser/Thr protein kinase)